jgi:Transposase
MTQGRVEVMVERRRRWSAAEKRQLVAASLEPGASVSAIAREAGIHPGQCDPRAVVAEGRAEGMPALATELIARQVCRLLSRQYGQAGEVGPGQKLSTVIAGPKVGER